MNVFPMSVLTPSVSARWVRTVVALACCGILGCGSDATTRGVRVPVDGAVRVDGEPLAAGRIVYMTDQGAGQVKATAAIVNGFYSFTEENGPLAGQARVEIYAQEMELEEFESVRDGDHSKMVNVVKVHIPAKYNTHSELTVNVQPEAESNLFQFELTTN